MSGTSKTTRLQSLLGMIVLGYGIGSFTSGVRSQGPVETNTRQLWDTAFITKDSKPVTTPSTSAAKKYKVATPTLEPNRMTNDSVLGITVWQLRQAQSSDRGERLVAQKNTGSLEWIPERVEADTLLSGGQHVRLGIETVRAGYLYVIDREQYADGTMGDPHLIFPSLQTNAGHNEMKPRHLIEIPAQLDNPPWFTLQPSRRDQVREVISILFTRSPLKDLIVGVEPLKLSRTRVAAWEKAWGTRVGRLEMENGVGTQYTKREKEAGANSNYLLKPDDPRPQTLFYRLEAKPGEPVMVSVHLHYGSTISTSR